MNRLTPHELATARRICTRDQTRALEWWNTGAGYTRIGFILGISRDSARGRVERALHQLRTELERQDAAA